MAYRAIHDSILTDPVFFAFSADAKLVFFALKLRLPATGIGVVLLGEIADLTKLDRDRVSDTLSELESAGWVKRESTVVWIVRGLEHDPNVQVRSPKVWTMLDRLVSELPNLAIVQEWRARYTLSDRVSDTVSDRVSKADTLSDTLSDTLPDTLETVDKRLLPDSTSFEGESEGENPRSDLSTCSVCGEIVNEADFVTGETLEQVLDWYGQNCADFLTDDEIERAKAKSRSLAPEFTNSDGVVCLHTQDSLEGLIGTPWVIRV